ncbi:hypothetical protein LTR36_009629 [Oleoguttula mirabilis]|uniref:RING-type domain-containing protein n=1 Tax=Oleoguttula mirabilis TaxID=1507867 RepID=A0AAV9J5Q9_9PEZI|nr:hypothetical protein LTR36_009629 [Oleoguttula mirabilis]
MAAPGSCDHFVETGIVPLLHSSSSTCWICTRVLDAERIPSQIHCGHVFCKGCIEAWAKTGHSRCPEKRCRQRLIFPSVEVELAKHPDLISKVVSDFREEMSMGRADRVGRELRYNIQEAYTAAQFFAEYHRGKVSLPAEDFGISIDMNAIDAHLVAIGNIAPVMAWEVGKPYTSRQTDTMPSILEAIHVVFQRLSRQQIHSNHEDMRLARMLKASVAEELAKQGVDLHECGFTADGSSPGNRERDFNMLLNYMLLVAHQSLLSKPLPPIGSAYTERAGKRAKLFMTNVRR